jgi:hypothetical protein
MATLIFAMLALLEPVQQFLMFLLLYSFLYNFIDVFLVLMGKALSKAPSLLSSRQCLSSTSLYLIRTSLGFCLTSGCPWPKATVKPPV